MDNLSVHVMWSGLIFRPFSTKLHLFSEYLPCQFSFTFTQNNNFWHFTVRSLHVSEMNVHFLKCHWTRIGLMLSIDNWVPHSGMLLYLHHRNFKLFFHPVKFDNFKDEKVSDFETVSVLQSKNLLDWKPALA